MQAAVVHEVESLQEAIKPGFRAQPFYGSNASSWPITSPAVLPQSLAAITQVTLDL